MTEPFSDNFKSIMSDIDTGDAFDTSVVMGMSSLNEQLDNLVSNQDTIFGSFSPIHGNLDGLHDTTPLTLDDINALNPTQPDGSPIVLTDAQKTQLVGRPKGILTNISDHASKQFTGLVDNLSLYSTHQKVQNALGTSTACGSLSSHFGSITAFGNDISDNVKAAKFAIDDFQNYKTQIQSEINNFDNNAISLLTGHINGTILSQIVVGSGIHDQMDKILTAAGINISGPDGQYLKAQIGNLLIGNPNIFFNKKAGVNSAVKAVSDKRGSILQQVATELASFDGALTTLKKLGNANALTSLFKADQCAKTILGFVATTPFLNKLGSV